MSLSYAFADPPRGILRLTGEDRVAFLQGLVSNDIRKVDGGHGVWTAFLTPQGKYLHDFFVTAQGETLLIDAEGPRIADLQRRLKMFRLRAKVQIEDASADYEVALGWGGGAAAALGLGEPGTAKELSGGVALADPRLPALGVRIVLPTGTAASILKLAGFTASDWAAWDRLRLGLGVADGSRDLELEKAILMENGFDELNGIAWDKGCYMGQELTARTKYRGLVKKRLIPVVLDGALLAPGTVITRSDGAEAGEIRSSRDALALALVRLDALATGAVLRAGESSVRPLVRD